MQNPHGPEKEDYATGVRGAIKSQLDNPSLDQLTSAGANGYKDG